MEFIILLLPLLGFLTNIAFIKNVQLRTSVNFPVIFMGLNVVLCLYTFNTVCVNQETKLLNLGAWINSGLLNVNWSFYLDNLTVTMLLVVNLVSFLVHLYSTEYMKNDPYVPRFMAYLSLFTFFMILLVTGDNFVILFLGWEGVGLCSYLLISFWSTRVQANKAAMKALIVNRISDYGFTVGMACIFFVFKSLDFSVVFGLAPMFANKTLIFATFNLDILSLIAFLLFFGACGKSAQIGLHTWLPDAMEGPTPVSALIHAATMVTAGVFLIIKCSPIFEFAPSILSLITFVGALTAFFGATSGLVQNDIKKVIAYSTCSQLGYMVFACGLSAYNVSFFHLVNHAFFKALLFLTAGAIIHSMSNEQDLRKYGSLMELLPFCAVMLLIGSLSLMGFPFLTGFYSKDLILEIAYAKYTVAGHFSYWLGLITAFFTAFYSYRIFYLTFVIKTNAYKKTILTTHELPLRMAIALIVLSVGSIFFGYVMKDLFVGLGSDFWNKSIFILPKNNSQVEAEFIPHFFKIIPFFSSLIAIVVANTVFIFNIQVNTFFNFVPFYKFLSYKWYFDVIYNVFFNYPFLYKSYAITFKLLDKGLLEFLGPFGISAVVYKLGFGIKKFQNSLLFCYAMYMFFFLLLFILIGFFYE